MNLTLDLLNRPTVLAADVDNRVFPSSVGESPAVSGLFYESALARLRGVLDISQSNVSIPFYETNSAPVGTLHSTGKPIITIPGDFTRADVLPQNAGGDHLRCLAHAVGTAGR
jgi:hypothetical protein